MEQSFTEGDAAMIAAAMDAEIRSLNIRNTSTLRAVRRKYSQVLKEASGGIVFQLAEELCKVEAYRWLAYELIRAHPTAFKRLGPAELERLGRGINSWWTADAFARTLSGPAWLHGQTPDSLILKWANSNNFWWRRAALVSTVALNVRSQGGRGDVSRTLDICRKLASDPDEMVTKALSWALRELVVHDAGVVKAFIDQHEDVLAARVNREVMNKLNTGLKNPVRKGCQ